jgi:hypothetical protein
MSKNTTSYGFVEHRITMVAKKDGDNTTMCWQRNDGKIVSPIFTSQEACCYYGNKMPLITDEEWAVHYPLSSQGNLNQTPVFVETNKTKTI